MGRALPVWAMIAACVCGTGKAGKRPRQPKAAGWVFSSRSFSPQMVPPWRRVEAICSHTYGTWLLWADVASILAIPALSRLLPLDRKSVGEGKSVDLGGR